MTRPFESALVRYCAPTLAGWKAASLFCAHGPAEELRRNAGHWARRLAPAGLSLQILRERRDSALVYVFRREQLERILSVPECRRFLEVRGYPSGGLEPLLAELARRLEGPAFPHELGLFLDYPLEDVAGFIAHRGRRFTCQGPWKAYGDPAKAQARFDRLRRCTQAYVRLFRLGIPPERLAVSASSTDWETAARCPSSPSKEPAPQSRPDEQSCRRF